MQIYTKYKKQINNLNQRKMEVYHIKGYFVFKQDGVYQIWTSYHITGTYIQTVNTVREAENLINTL